MRLFNVAFVSWLYWGTLTCAGPANWTKPNSQSPSFTDTYLVGEHIILTWFSLNNSINDLWLTRYNATESSFSNRLDIAKNISVPGSFEWTIVVSEEEIARDTRFILQFLPTGSAYDPTAALEIPSPAFNLNLVNQQTPSNGTIGAPSPVAATNTASATYVQVSETLVPSATPISSDITAPIGPPPSLSGVAKAGIGIAAAVVGISAIVAAVFSVGAYRRRAKKKPEDPAEEMTGPYEVLGDRRQPTELNSKEANIHELNSSKETMVYESDSSTIHEISTTIKKPGLHELPG